MTRRSFLRVACGAALAAGCSHEQGPVEPVWGKQPCAYCSMLLGDRRFGGQILSDSGERLYFDDVGCMVLFCDGRGWSRPRAWVREARSGAWVDALAARYESGAASPMDFGFAAAAAGDLGWDEVRARVLVDASARRGS